MDSINSTKTDEIRGIISDELRKLTKPEYVCKIDVCDRLNVSLQTVNNWIASGKLPAFKAGKRVLIKSSDVDSLIEQKKITK